MKKASVAIAFAAVVLAAFASCNLFSPISEEAAIGKFKEWLTGEGIPEQPTSPMTGMLLGDVLKGDIVGSELPVPRTAGFSAKSAGSGALPDNGRLFYLDQAPGAFYEHPGKIVVIGSRGKILYSEDTEGWPTVNGTRPSALDSFTSSSYHSAIVWNPWQILKPEWMVKDWQLPLLFLRIKGAVVINGLINSENLYSEGSSMHGDVLDSMEEMFTAAHAASVTSATAVANPYNRIHNAVNNLVSTEDINRLTLYFIGHGGDNYIKIGGHAFTVDDLRTLIGAFPGVKFCVIMETCHAGSWLDNFDGSLVGYPELPNLTIFTASTSPEKSAYPDWDSATTGSGSTIYDFDTTDSYVEWTSDFLKQLDAWSSGANYSIVQAYATAHNIDVEASLYYHAFWKVKGSPGVPPAGGFSPGGVTYTLTERTGVGIQSPMVYAQWL